MNSFSTLGISESLLRAVDQLGFTSPTAIQNAAIPVLLSNERDLVALARTGTGKTAAFGIPLLQNLDLSAPGPEALVLAPTRELCCQIARDLSQFARFMPGVQILPIYGGAGMREQILGLKKNPRVIAATPGRLLDHLTRGSLDLSNLRTLVLDEADEMLSMGFKDELEAILATTPAGKRTCLFSATMGHEIRSIAERHLRDPIEVSVVNDSTESLLIEHRYALVHHQDRLEALRRFIAQDTSMYGIVFCRTRESTREVADILAGDGFSADALHGDLSQQQREYVMNRFRKGLVKLLVATDVAARGLDVDNVTHVLHYELPSDVDGYIHRSGRTARAGKSGISLAIVTPRETPRLRRLEYTLKTRFTKVHAPSGADILSSRVSVVLDRLESEPIGDDSPGDYIAVAQERLAEMPREELIRRFLQLQMKEHIASYGEAGNLPEPQSASYAGFAGGRRDRYGKDSSYRSGPSWSHASSGRSRREDERFMPGRIRNEGPATGRPRRNEERDAGARYPAPATHAAPAAHAAGSPRDAHVSPARDAYGSGSRDTRSTSPRDSNSSRDTYATPAPAAAKLDSGARDTHVGGEHKIRTAGSPDAGAHRPAEARRDADRDVRRPEPRREVLPETRGSDRAEPWAGMSKRDSGSRSRPRYEPIDTVSGGSGGDFVGVRIPMGKADGMTKVILLNLLNRHMGDTRFPVGNINIGKSASFVELPEDIANRLSQRIGNA